MNFKKNIISILIFTSILSATSKYELSLHVDDPDKRYKVDIELFFSDNNTLESANFKYPHFNCESISKDSAREGNLLEIEEKIIKGQCNSMTYAFNFGKDGDSKKISSVELYDGNVDKPISTTILSMKYSNSSSKKRKKVNNNKTYYNNGNLECEKKRDNGELIQVQCYYRDGEIKNIVNFVDGKAKDGKKYYGNGNVKEMTNADFHNLGYTYHKTEVTNNNSGYSGQIVDLDK